MRTRTIVSAWSMMSTSAWPTPTVSRNTSSLPAASMSSAAWSAASRQPAERAAVGHRADEDAGVEEVLGEADAVPEQRAVGEGRARVDREHRDVALGLAAQLRQRADERRLAGARARPSGRRSRPCRCAGRPRARAPSRAGSSDSTSVIAAGERALVTGRGVARRGCRPPLRAQTTFGRPWTLSSPPGRRSRRCRRRSAREPPRRATAGRSRSCASCARTGCSPSGYAQLALRLAWLKLRFRGRLAPTASRSSARA